MSKLFTVRPPAAQKGVRITASVGFVSPSDHPGAYLIVRNKRGWDIPGGHIEEDESPLETFVREVREETACDLLPGAQLIAILESTKNQSTGIAVYRGTCQVNSFKPHEEIREVSLVAKDDLPARYFGDQDLLRELLGLLQD